MKGSGGGMALVIVRLLVMAAAIYGFASPSVFTWGGYALSVDGVVVARCACLLFAMQQLVGMVRDVQG